MSWQATNAVLEYSAQKGSELLTLLILANYSDESNECYPSIPTLARNTRMSVRQVTRIIKSLETAGEIEVRKGGGRVSNRYRLLFPTPDKMAPLVAPDGRAPLTQLRQGTPDIAASPEQSYKRSDNKKEGELLSVDPQYFPAEWTGSQPFAEAWAEYLAIRKKKKYPLTPFCLQRLSTTLKQWTIEVATKQLIEACLGGWRDIYPPKLSSREEKRRPITKSAAERGYILDGPNANA